MSRRLIMSRPAHRVIFSSSFLDWSMHGQRCLRNAHWDERVNVAWDQHVMSYDCESLNQARWVTRGGDLIYRGHLGIEASTLIQRIVAISLLLLVFTRQIRSWLQFTAKWASVSHHSFHGFSTAKSPGMSYFGNKTYWKKIQLAPIVPFLRTYCVGHDKQEGMESVSLSFGSKLHHTSSSFQEWATRLQLSQWWQRMYGS